MSNLPFTAYDPEKDKLEIDECIESDMRMLYEVYVRQGAFKEELLKRVRKLLYLSDYWARYNFYTEVDREGLHVYWKNKYKTSGVKNKKSLKITFARIGKPYYVYSFKSDKEIISYEKDCLDFDENSTSLPKEIRRLISETKSKELNEN